MISTSANYNKIISLGGGKFYSGAHVALANGNTLELTGKNIMLDGGFEIEDAVSEPDKFQVGAVVINQLTLSLCNFDGEFNEYDFNGAVITPWVGLVTQVRWDTGEVVEKLQKGVFTVYEAPTVGSLVGVTADDNMAKFDVAYSKSTLVYPATLGQIAADACSVCGVPLETTTFPNSTYTVAKRPSDASTTCREILSYVAQLAGCFARCNTSGAVEIRWYEEPESGTLYDVGENAESVSCDLADTVITGVQIQGNDDSKTVYSSGTNDFALRIESNPLAQDNLQSLVDTLGTKFNGFAFRAYEVSTKPNPAVEAGDIVNMTDKSGAVHRTLVSRLTYSFGDYETFGGDAETQAENQSERFTAADKAQDTADQAQQGVTEAKAEITTLNGQIVLKADKGSLISQINICPESIKISGDRIDISGLVTISNLENGETTIDGACIQTGRIESEDGSYWVDLTTGEVHMEKGTFGGSIEWDGGSIYSAQPGVHIEADGGIEMDGSSISLNSTSHGSVSCGGDLNVRGSLEVNGAADGNWNVQMADGSTHRFYFTKGILTDVD